MGRLLTSLLILSCLNFLQVFAQPQSCSSEGSVSIRSATTTPSSGGRVEYCFRPSSAGGALFLGIVCNSTFLLNEAHVACRTINSAYSAYTTLPGAVFSQRDLEYQVQVDCTGYERSLSECTVTEVTSPNPSSCLFVSAGVSCNTEGITNNVILAGSGRDTEGYVMIFRSSSWHFLVASSTYWTDTHAGVVCRQLGYSGGVVPSDTSGYSPQPNTFPPFQASFACSSTAMELNGCIDQTVFNPSPMLVAASCSLSNSADGTLVLTNNSLQVAFDGRFGAVCRSDFSSPEASVACRQLGFPSSISSSTLSQSVFASRPRYLSGLGCSGSESSLLSCPYTSPPGTVCAGGNGVRLICEQPPTGLSGGAIAGIVVPIVLIVVLIILTSVYHKQIGVKLREYKGRLQTWWNNLTICPRRSTVSTSSSQRPSSQPTATTERQRTEPAVQESQPARVTEPVASSSAAAEPEVLPNPQLSAEAPPTYRDADQFQRVTEEDDPDIEKPPPYIDPMGAVPSAPPPVGGAAFYPPTAPTYPPTYPPVDPAYPPTYPPTDSAYPPPPHGAFAYPSQPPQ